VIEYIDAHRIEFGVEPICRQLQVAPSTYYSAKASPPCARSVTDVQVSEVIAVEHAANYGARKHTQGFVEGSW
jgi:putative transposase